MGSIVIYALLTFFIARSDMTTILRSGNYLYSDDKYQVQSSMGIQSVYGKCKWYKHPDFEAYIGHTGNVSAAMFKCVLGYVNDLILKFIDDPNHIPAEELVQQHFKRENVNFILATKNWTLTVTEGGRYRTCIDFSSPDRTMMVGSGSSTLLGYDISGLAKSENLKNLLARIPKYDALTGNNFYRIDISDIGELTL